MDAAAFRSALGQWPTGVAVVTTAWDGAWHGATVSSFSSVSLDPPLVSVCLATTAHVHERVARAGLFAVTVLGKDQAEVGRRFARWDPEVERFAEAWETAETGAPVLPTALAWLDCRVTDAHPAGDHTLFVGEVLAAATPRTTSPLLYHSRTWGQFADQLPTEVVTSRSSGSDVDVRVGEPTTDVQGARLLVRDAFADPAATAKAVGELVAAEPAEVVLCDDGAGTPLTVRETCREVLLSARPVPVAVRLTDAHSLGQGNLLTALKSGVHRLDLTDLDPDGVTRLLTSLDLRLQGELP